MVAGADKQLVGEVAAKIRGYRPPEPYKGKGVKYASETIIRKGIQEGGLLAIAREPGGLLLRTASAFGEENHGKRSPACVAPSRPVPTSANSACCACRCCAPASTCTRSCSPPTAPRCWRRLHPAGRRQGWPEERQNADAAAKGRPLIAERQGRRASTNGIRPFGYRYHGRIKALAEAARRWFAVLMFRRLGHFPMGVPRRCSPMRFCIGAGAGCSRGDQPVGTSQL